MFATAAFNVLNVIAQGSHCSADEAGAELVAKFGQQGFEYLQGDFTNVVADKQVVRAGNLYTDDARGVTQQVGC
jgi:hypothetical protein